MLRAFGHHVVSCSNMLDVVGLNLKIVKFFIQQLWMLHAVVVVWPGSCNNVEPGHAHWFNFQLGTRRYTLQRVAKRVQHVAPNNVAFFAFKCCDRLAGACNYWANDVGICCVEVLLSFGTSVKHLALH